MSIHNEPSDDPFDCPERALLRYLLMDAVERWREGKKEAARWLFLFDDGEPFGFEWTCLILGFDPEEFRGKLLHHRREISFFGVSVSGMCKRM